VEESLFVLDKGRNLYYILCREERERRTNFDEPIVTE
jgi:hypothetical protein